MILQARRYGHGPGQDMNAGATIFNTLTEKKPWAEVRYTMPTLIWHDHNTLNAIQDGSTSRGGVAFGMAFPVCTDMAVSGAAWFEKKRQANPSFQDEAVSYAVWCAKLFNSLHIPFFVENPISVLATKWRKPDYKFHPYEYGGYIPEAEAEHHAGQSIFLRRTHTRRRPVCGQAMALRCQSRGPWIQRRTTVTVIPRL
jgi:hypothetical protein